MFITIISIAFIISFVYETFVEDFKRQMFKIIFKNRIEYNNTFLDYKPFSCANCMSFWVSFFTLFICYDINILNILLISILSFNLTILFTKIIKVLYIIINQFFYYIEKKIK